MCVFNNAISDRRVVPDALVSPFSKRRFGIATFSVCAYCAAKRDSAPEGRSRVRNGWRIAQPEKQSVPVNSHKQLGERVHQSIKPPALNRVLLHSTQSDLELIRHDVVNHYQ